MATAAGQTADTLRAMTKRDRQGHELDLLEWADRRNDASYCVVDEGTVGEATVRTIWEGIDEIPGSMFLTGVAASGGPFATVADADTEDEARAVHQKVLTLLRGTAQPPAPQVLMRQVREL